MSLLTMKASPRRKLQVAILRHKGCRLGLRRRETVNVTVAVVLVGTADADLSAHRTGRGDHVIRFTHVQHAALRRTVA